MNLKEFVLRTLDDTIGFFEVHIRMLEALRDAEDNKDKVSGMQEAIDLLRESCETGKNVSDAFINKRMELLRQLMENEAQANGLEAVAACGPLSSGKKDLN